MWRSLSPSSEISHHLCRGSIPEGTGECDGVHNFISLPYLGMRRRVSRALARAFSCDGAIRVRFCVRLGSASSDCGVRFDGRLRILRDLTGFRDLILSYVLGIGGRYLSLHSCPFLRSSS